MNYPVSLRSALQDSAATIAANWDEKAARLFSVMMGNLASRAEQIAYDLLTKSSPPGT